MNHHIYIIHQHPLQAHAPFDMVGFDAFQPQFFFNVIRNSLNMLIYFTGDNHKVVCELCQLGNVQDENTFGFFIPT